ncbi:hypothetical protein [Naasia aerilata]|uniref:Uncharacterized protein n=1 Tax=Naasia aerilata TaxID=1162966 RepID=A0ABN6XHL0_9MICO|nr:hypothetical protein [Naasia aerilata]BDZ44382.1 hypothetical protein GCM10025866_02910 [Naasia aerilata]
MFSLPSPNADDLAFAAQLHEGLEAIPVTVAVMVLVALAAALAITTLRRRETGRELATASAEGAAAERRKVDA